MMNNRKINVYTSRFVLLFPTVICLGVYPQLEMTLILRLKLESSLV